ncbi:MAG: holo-ACP synthase [Chloroflexi bacterium]|nr:holo-ACP synthase [Chloroflexota bacterium]
MYYHGIDIIEIERIREALARWGDRFLRRIYTPQELKHCRGKVEELAVRFAAKEAVMKALGTGIRGVGWREIEILSNRRGAPQVVLHRRAQARAQALELEGLAVSLSHSRDFAIASVIGGFP